MNLYSILFFTLLFAIGLNCGTESSSTSKLAVVSEPSTEALPLPAPTEEFDRKENIGKLKSKINKGESISIHLLVPLCDNENQGIVPVSQKLGNGLDLRNNLYWGAMYGMKSHFKNSSSWKLLISQKDISESILERIILYRQYSNQARVYLIADAYRGDRMKICLEDFIQSMAGKKKEVLEVEDESIGIGSNADLLIFNGHNGLMDYDLDFVDSEDQVVRDVSVIGCISHNYFKDHLKHSRGYPVLMTTNLMAPESYVASALIDSWALLQEEQTIRTEVGKAYHQYQKCGLKGATKLFRTGW